MLHGRALDLAVLAVDEGKLLGGFGIELMLGVAAAELLEHTRGHAPVLHLHERRGRIVLGRAANIGCRRQRLDA